MATVNLILANPLPCYVGGQAFVASASYDVVDPHAPSKVLHTVSSVTEADVVKVIESAEKAFPGWRDTSVMDRRVIFLRAAALLRERLGEYAGLEYGETTSSGGWSGFEMTLAAASLEETAACATAALRGEIATTDSSQRAYIERCPFGIVFGMSPWNAPLVLAERAISGALMAGNCAILKTSENSPRTQLMIGQLFADAGLPAGVLSVIHVAPQDAPKVVEQIIAHPAVGKVNFTGSTRVGSIIAATCGKYIKPVVLELGGKAPVIICADADLPNAASAIMFGAWFHSGQICMATQTVIVHESVADELLALIKAHAPKVTASGSDADGAPLRGLFNDASASRVEDIVKDALSKGAVVAAGSAGFAGNVVQPIMLTGVTAAMRLHKEESFAPVFSFCTFKTEEEALRLANDNEYGLSSAVWSNNADTGFRLARGINSGAVHINGSSVADAAQVPHGGWKKSGYGRFNGFEGIREFTQIKVITVDQPHPYPI